MAKFPLVSPETGAHRRSLPHLAQDFLLISSGELQSTKMLQKDKSKKKRS